MNYPEYPESVTLMEEELLERWRAEDLFRKTLEATAGGEPFVFYEGPPTANGRPGLHHIFSRTLKDLICRYQAMLGHHVTRIAGWDTHGLPVEIEAERRLGISGKREIEEVGVARFNEVCRESVFTYKEEWERLSERIAYWLDYSAPYVTFDPDYIETVWWVLAQLHDRNFLYRGHRSVPYCPRCGTALSSHEVAQGYRDVEDPSVYFVCALLTDEGAPDPEGRAFLAWTTTPWTIPSNAGLAVHPELDYAVVQDGDRRFILAEARVEALFGEEATVIARMPGRDLVGTLYHRPFEILPAPEDPGGGWRVVAEDFVSAEEGTGIVHMAPAFGADDFAAGQKHDLPMFRPVDDAGRFLPEIPLVGGLFVKDADGPLVRDLEARGMVFRSGTVEHSYPHCWRCESPLLYMARDSWFLRTTAVKDRMLANNSEVGWHPPEVGSGRFGEWLEGNVDWALSRDRYWGTPLPVWVCDENEEHINVIGSFEELAERAGPLPADFDPHKPDIDEPAWECTQCTGTMRRVGQVIDVWFDSGAMPYAQWHYPFENRWQWERHFPADYICEGVDQTRGWFYSLMAISTMLDLGAAYRNVIVNGLILDAEGQKMSKSRGNVVDPWEALGRNGADAVRWYLVTVSHPWTAKRFDPDAVGEVARRTFDTLANTYRFFSLYANLEGWEPDEAGPAAERRPIMDRWVLSRLSALVTEVRAALDGYDVTTAGRAIAEFVVSDLSNWYVRRSRDRFWGAKDRADTAAAFDTLHRVLVTVARLLAPFTPFVADWLHRALSSDQSAHLAAFPRVEPGWRDETLETQMDAARALSSLGRAAREAVQIRVRQPLRTLHAVLPPGVDPSEEVLAVVREELNVKEVSIARAAGDFVAMRGVPKFAAIGPRFGARSPHVARAIAALSPDQVAMIAGGGAATFTVEGEEVSVGSEEVEVLREALPGLVVESADGFTAVLDTRVDRELRSEGLARELVNRIQRARRDAGLQVQDRIRLAISGDEDVQDAVRRHREFISRETLARELYVGDEVPGGSLAEERRFELDGLKAGVALAVI